MEEIERCYFILSQTPHKTYNDSQYKITCPELRNSVSPRRRTIAEVKQRWSVIGWVTKNLLSRAPPCFRRHVKLLVPNQFNQFQSVGIREQKKTKHCHFKLLRLMSRYATIPLKWAFICSSVFETLTRIYCIIFRRCSCLYSLFLDTSHAVNKSDSMRKRRPIPHT
jgi:hypothetical protein